MLKNKITNDSWVYIKRLSNSNKSYKKYIIIFDNNNKNNNLISKQFNNNNKSNITNISVPWRIATRTTITFLETTKKSILSTL